MQSLTALNSSRQSSFNSFVADGTWLYFLADTGEDLQKISNMITKCRPTIVGLGGYVYTTKICCAGYFFNVTLTNNKHSKDI